MSVDKVIKLFKALTPKEQAQVLSTLIGDQKSVDVDTKLISEFAQRHQKEYQKDITFSVEKIDDSNIKVTLHTSWGDYAAYGKNQKIAKTIAVKEANEDWN